MPRTVRIRKKLQETKESVSFDVIIPIREELKKVLIFGFKSRLVIAKLLSFIGWRQQVLPLMQTISHGTRAYIVNAEGLPGFVPELNFMQFLKDAEKKGHLEQVRKLQEINLKNLRQGLPKKKDWTTSWLSSANSTQVFMFLS